MVKGTVLFCPQTGGIVMQLIGAVGNYLIRLVMYTAVAAAGIAVGIKLRKAKNAKQEQEENLQE